ncbi:hypothetical protein EJ05DRAFT_498000 [Pseudovirgaria hyperparasitica]|uniref:Low temperature requirement A n=1 Tax=Pseudovirgaria hyperparasitica TaxID=470096 RepID=A0A6A6WF47_9PEZI|nr:uncharacterized protein EJ05DRAFT_498000 [Pseudovirgaria hyperparasitica]KAF2761448.1 hypothetical protein EJ05DRAFT_498000 [Pseudovirgaria hyperparasitica]
MTTALPHFDWSQRKGKQQKYAVVPCISDPTSGVKMENDDGSGPIVFGQRHEASSMELFFDLFFVANLALFTQYHIIIEHSGFLGYIEFFSILWGTWFSVTLFDVRFASDSLYERACKLIQCAVFVVLSLVGSHFEPGTVQTYGQSETPSNDTFRILSYALATSRALLAIQYIVVAVFCARRGYRKVLVPVGLNALFYCISAVAFGLMTLAFRRIPFLSNVYIVWYVILALEIAGVLSVSTVWRDLGFKLTHLVERMSLLTLIIIGEGILGVGKTISIILRTHENAEYYGLIFVILLIIIFLWMIYFDNTPHGHFGTIRQQIWAFLHFPLHLSILGIVEGAQQLVRGRYWIHEVIDIATMVHEYCLSGLDGTELSNALASSITSYKFEDKSIAGSDLPDLMRTLVTISNTPGLCNSTSIRDLPTSWTFDELYAAINGTALFDLVANFGSALYGSTIVDNNWPTQRTLDSVNRDEWSVPYSYFWGSLAIFAFVSHILISLRRKTRADIFLFVQTLSRILVLAVAIALGVVGSFNDTFYYNFTDSPSVVTIAMGCLAFVFISDYIGRVASNWQVGKRNERLDIDDEGEKR